MFYDENKYSYEYTFNERDEAKIQKAKAEERIRLQQLRSEESEKIRQSKFEKWFLLGLVILIVACFVFGAIMASLEGPDEDEVQMPCSASDLEGENYEIVVKRLENMGFHNIETITIDAGWFDDEGDVEQVTIAGDNDFDKGDIFSKDVKITVAYYT